MSRTVATRITVESARLAELTANGGRIKARVLWERDGSVWKEEHREGETSTVVEIGYVDPTASGVRYCTHTPATGAKITRLRMPPLDAMQFAVFGIEPKVRPERFGRGSKEQP
jgi:hypothetical protein